MDCFLYDRDLRHERFKCHFMRFFAAAKTSLIHYYKTINLELVS